MHLAELVAKWDNAPYNGDYEVRKLVEAYHNGFLDSDGQEWLMEELLEYF